MATLRRLPIQNSRPSVILGLHYASLQIARSLGSRGIGVFGIDSSPHRIAKRSRFIQVLDAPVEDEGLKDYLIDFSKRKGFQPVIFPMSDSFALFLIKYRNELSKHCFFPCSASRIERKLIGKVATAELLSQLDISCPKSIIIKKEEASRTPLEHIKLPCIIKPDYQENWIKNPLARSVISLKKPVVIVEEQSELEKIVNLLAPFDDIVLQEFIPGPSQNSYYYVGYRSYKGNILVSHIGHKLRTFPDRVGSETLLKSVHMPELQEYGDRILHQLEWHGPAGIDFKLDPRDNQFKVIEINCRVGINDCYLMKYGVDLAYFYYLDSQEIDVLPQTEYPVDVTWYNFAADFEWMRACGKKENVTWPEWIRQLVTGYDNYALFSWRDPGPFIYSNIHLFRRLATRMTLIPRRLRKEADKGFLLEQEKTREKRKTSA